MTGIVFAGGEIGAFVPADSDCVESVTSGRFDSARSRCAIRVYNISSYAESRAFASNLTTMFFHADWGIENADASEQTSVAFYDSGGTEVFRINRSGGTPATIKPYYWNGSSWVATGSTFTVSAPQLMTIDLKVVPASGWELYINGTLRDSASVVMSAFSNLSKVRLKGTYIGYNFWSQVIVSGTSTVGLRLVTDAISGAGNSNNWTSGTYADVDEQAYNDTDGLASATNNQVFLCAGSSPSLDGFTVRGVIVTARVRQGTLLNYQHAVRSNGANYFTASQAVSAGYGAFVGIWETDPDTTATWTGAAALAAQFGGKSIT